MFELVYFFQKKEQRSHVELKDELKWKEAFTQRLNSSTEFNCLYVCAKYKIGKGKEEEE